MGEEGQERGLHCGEAAARRLAPYEPEISGNFEIARHVGKLIAAWDRPKFVTAADAAHMRAADYVVGVLFRGHARAYPLWVTDNYHMINDTIEDEPLLFSTCERCQSGSAFLARVAGEPTKFSALGMHNASLTMVNRRRGRQGPRHSLWLHYEGVAIDGPETGHFLEQLPSYHTTWADWVDRHPETDVMLAPEDPHHRDSRHGHGREEFFARPGMDPPLARTITGRFDHRYPENEIVLGINIDAGLRAYPMLEVKREGGVVNDVLGELPIVVLAGPRPEQVCMGAYAALTEGRRLTFECNGVGFTDRETGSTWTIEGEAVSGALQGRRLVALRWQYVRWHAWVYPHPTTELFTSRRLLPLYPDFGDTPQVAALRPLLTALSRLRRDIRLSHVVVELRLPHEAEHGLCVIVERDRLNLYRFRSAEAAQDYVDLRSAWFCLPFDVKVGARRALRRVGRFVVESDPDQMFAEPSQTVRYPDHEVPWSDVVTDDALVARWAGEMADEPAGGVRFAGLIHHLRSHKIDIVEAAFLPHSQLRPGCVNAVAMTIEGDRFAVYRADSESDAQRALEDVTHAVRIGCWVFRSMPVLMYADPHYEMGQLPDEKIAWSPLLADETFLKTVRKFLEP